MGDAQKQSEEPGQGRGADEGEALLAPAFEAAKFPVLARLLAGPDGAAVRAELTALLPQLRQRAPRRILRVVCRLLGPAYDEPVLLTDVSTSGVRFLVQSDVPLDLTKFGSMTLRVRTSRGLRELQVALVRRCGGDERHTDVACRFLATDDDIATTVAELRSSIFGEA